MLQDGLTCTLFISQQLTIREIFVSSLVVLAVGRNRQREESLLHLIPDLQLIYGTDLRPVFHSGLWSGLTRRCSPQYTHG